MIIYLENIHYIKPEYIK